MSLPELEWQFIYGRIAWAFVLAGLIVAVFGTRYRLARSHVLLVVAGSGLLQLLPGEYSLAYWLGLAFQLPSGLLVGLCLVRLHLAWQGRPGKKVMTTRLAAGLVLVGAAFYLDAFGLLSRGYYYWGFGPKGAPLLAIALAGACSVAIFRHYARLQAFALLGALALFSVLRLPSGNLWDALVDPFLVFWALAAVALALYRWSKRPRQQATPAGATSVQ